MPTPNNLELYNAVKLEADAKYKKPSAYKSGYIVKRYKSLGGTYANDGKTKNLARWFKEKWQDVGNSEYPVYRPSKRINKLTPLLVSEINKNDLLKQIFLKQIIKGDYNLPKFKKK
jgi:hypothetical protein